MKSDPKDVADLASVNELVERDLFHFLFDRPDSPVLVIDAVTLQIVVANQAFSDLAEASLPKLKSKPLSWLVPSRSDEAIAGLLSSVSKRKTKMAEFTAPGASSASQALRIRVQYVGGRKPSFVVFVNKVDPPSQRSVGDQLTSAIESLSDGFVLYDRDDRLVVCNEHYRQIYPESAEAMIPGRRFEDILRFGLKNDQYVLGGLTAEQWLQKRLEDHRNCTPVAEQRLSNGRWLQIVERETSDGGRVGLRVDITDQKRQQDALRKLSNSDDLTGLLNRRGLYQCLSELADQSQSSERIAILHIDLDNFKAINEVYGFDAGDHVLKNSARILQDFRPNASAVARIASDEFVVVLVGSYTNEQVVGFAERAVSRLNVTHRFNQQTFQVGASVGVSFFEAERFSDVKECVVASDIALNEAKRDGGNRAMLFDTSMRERIVEQLDMAKDIRRGLIAEEFLPYFQPQLDTSTSRVVGFEALIRWDHPQQGLVPAFKFLNVAQRVGLTEALDDIVMDKSCAAARQMIDWKLDPVRISINLSQAQISDPRILQRLQSHMLRHRVEPENLHIELLESTLLDDRASLIVKNVHRLIRAGFSVELDDFGTGHAAIATLRRFQVSRIKVDRSLIHKIDHDTELQVITAALIDLAQNLGIDALAEGVETYEEQSKLTEMGCYVVQGYLHARPMPLHELKAWLEDRGDLPKPANPLPA